MDGFQSEGAEAWFRESWCRKDQERVLGCMEFEGVG